MYPDTVARASKSRNGLGSSRELLHPASPRHRCRRRFPIVFVCAHGGDLLHKICGLEICGHNRNFVVREVDGDRICARRGVRTRGHIRPHNHPGALSVIPSCIETSWYRKQRTGAPSNTRGCRAQRTTQQETHCSGLFTGVTTPCVFHSSDAAKDFPQGRLPAPHICRLETCEHKRILVVVRLANGNRMLTAAYQRVRSEKLEARSLTRCAISDS